MTWAEIEHRHSEAYRRLIARDQDYGGAGGRERHRVPEPRVRRLRAPRRASTARRGSRWSRTAASSASCTGARIRSPWRCPARSCVPNAASQPRADRGSPVDHRGLGRRRAPARSGAGRRIADAVKWRHERTRPANCPSRTPTSPPPRRGSPAMPIARRCMTSRTVNARTGAEVFFKCENLQRMGAFKFRGAYNALAQLSDAEQKRRGVLTYSSGNHAQAIALAGTLLGIRTTIVMPDDAPAVKLAATRGYGGEVIIYDKNATTREALGAAHRRRARAHRDSALRPPARRRRAGHGGEGADRGGRAARLAVRAVAAAAACSRAARSPPRSSRPGARSSASSPRRATTRRGRSGPRRCRPSTTPTRSPTARARRRWER